MEKILTSNEGIAYGFVRSELPLQDLETLLLSEKGSTTLSLKLAPLNEKTHFSSSNGEFESEVKRAIRGRMNYAVEARILNDGNYLVAIKLTNLFRVTLGEYDHGAIYWDDGGFHHSNDERKDHSLQD